MRLSTFGSILSALTVGAACVSPAFADGQASISGSATFISPAAFTSTVSGESVLPKGIIFNAVAATTTLTPAAISGTGVITPASLSSSEVIVVPAYNLISSGPTVIATTSLSVGSSGLPAISPTPTSFSAAAATILTNSAAAISVPATIGIEGRTVVVGANTVYASGNIDFISAIIKAGSGVNGLD